MSCDDIRKLLPGLVSEALSEKETQQASEHLESCEGCRRELERLSKTLSYTTLWEDEVPPPTLVPSTISIIREKKPLLPAFSFLRLSYVLGGLLAVAMMVSLYCGYFLQPDDQQTLLYAQEQLLAGSPASFRVVLLTRSAGKPINGGTVTAGLRSSDGKVDALLFSQKTGKNGTVEPQVTIPDVAGGRYSLIIKTKSFHGSDIIIRPVTVTKRYRMLLSTDKPIYQPGQVIHMRTLAIENGRAETPEKGDVLIEVLDPKGNKVYRKAVTVGSFGVSAADFQLAREINLGDYHLKAAIGPDVTERVVQVKRYVLPKFKVTFNPSRRTYLPSETVTGTVQAEYFFGKKTQNARVSLDLFTFDVAFHKIAHIEGKTDGNGVYRFSLSLPSYFAGQPIEKGKGVIKCDVTVIDKAGHEEKVTDTLTVAESLQPEQGQAVSQGAKGKIPVVIDCIPERKSLVSDVENRVFVVTSVPGGSPLSCQVTLKLPDRTLESRSDEFGVAEFSFKPSAGQVNMSIEAVQGEEYFGFAKVSLSAGTDKGDILLRTDRSLYQTGDSMKITLRSAYQQGWIYVDLVKDRQTVLTRSVELQNGRADMTLSLSEDMVGALQINAYRIRNDGNTVRDGRTVTVQHSDELSVTAAADRDVYRPGDKAKLSFQVRDRKGRPVQAALGLNIVDESVFVLAEKHPGLEKVYLALEREILEPKIALCSHNSCIDMKSLASQPSYTPGSQRAAAVLLAALGDSAAGDLINSFQEKAQRFEETMRRFRTAGFIMFCILFLGLVVWSVVEVEKRQRESGRPDDASLLSPMHYLAVGIFSLTLCLIMASDSLRYLDSGMLLMIIATTAIFMACYIPFLSLIIYYYRSAGPKGAAICAAAIAASVAGALGYMCHSHQYLFGQTQFILIAATFFTGIISFIGSLLVAMKSHWGLRGVAGGLLLVVPLLYSLSRIQDFDSGAGCSLLFVFVASLVIYYMIPVKANPLRNNLNLLTLVSILIALAVVIAPNFLRARSQGTLTACKSNLKNIGTALEMYSSDHGGHYPEKLSELTPNYLKTIPTCPCAGKDTYSASYRSTANPDYYLVFCSGSNHKGLPPNFPQYDSVQGLCEGGQGLSGGPAGNPADKKPAPLIIAGIKVRQFFPETLYWNPLIVTDEAGVASVDLEMADTITTWRMTGMANTRRGVTGSFTKPIRAFQNFFIDPDLPEHLTRGDSLTVPVALYNYLPTTQSLEVSLVKEGWFDVTGPAVKMVSVSPNDVSSVPFTIKVMEVGDYRFTVLARSSSQKDAVSKPIRVDPDGREVQVTTNGTLDKALHCSIPIPADSVPGGSTILVKIYPGVTTQMLDGLEGMLRMPYG